MLSGFVKKLLFARQFNIDNGAIAILGKNQVMMPVELLTDLEAIDKEKAYSVVKDNTLSIVKEYAKKVGSTSTGMIKSMQEIYELWGLGKPEIVLFDLKKKTAVIRMQNSPQSGNKQTCCHVNAAALAGMFSFLLKNDVNCTETKCGMSQKSVCEFKVSG